MLRKEHHGEELRHLISSRRRLWYTGRTIQAGMNYITREALLSEAGFEKVFRTQNWVRRSKLFCRWFCFLLGQAGCISVAA